MRLERVAHIHATNAIFLAPDLHFQIQQIEFDGVEAQTPCAFYNFSWSGASGMTTRNSTFIGRGRLGPSVRNRATFAVDNIRSDGVMIDRAYVIALQPPATGDQRSPPDRRGAPSAPG